ncbi:MAG TPA: dynamin family protein [Actinophytocola sp.]|uniref:dynamin family protein n=1 Tax=Actinophytocola sp. TaxID=1872138 RepID=UPI002DDC9B03|nr:dynamin family protein [Actinophytocola sp.]HEV2782905.1 dynamin family protein [Actinophytocola sp.]
MSGLLDQVWTMLNRTLEVYRDNPRASHWLRRQADRLDGPLRIAVVGQQKAGKSTLVNALVGEHVAPLVAEDGPAMVWYRAGATPRATVFGRGVEPQERPAERLGGRLSVDLGEWRGEQIDRVVVDWPARGLRGMTLIDTSTMDKVAAAEADAVLYLAQHLQAADLRLLQAMQDHPIAMANPVGALLVLSRADEVGAGQLDALFGAKRLARQHRRDARIRGLCQDVVAVTGLLAFAGRALRQPEFDALAVLAFGPRAEVDGYLLSADRFAGAEFPVAVDAEMRRALLDRLGLFGLRLSTALIRQGFDTHTALCAELVARSGLTELRAAIGRCFTERAPVLKARSAAIALEVVLRMEPRPEALGLAAELERILAGAHDLRELRLIATLHAGYPVLPDELSAEARQLLGGDGVSLPARLGLAEEEPTASGLRHAVVAALRRWREQAENPILDESARSAAAVVVRSCEGMLASVSG